MVVTEKMQKESEENARLASTAMVALGEPTGCLWWTVLRLPSSDSSAWTLCFGFVYVA